MSNIFHEVQAERDRACQLFPLEGGLPDGTGGGGRETWMVIARNACQRAEREGRLTWADILDEESSEALAATDRKNLRKELFQIMATCQRWIEQIDKEA